jgi:Domain of unknown function (DUF4160)
LKQVDNIIFRIFMLITAAVAVYQIAPAELMAGSLPRRQARLVEAWAELHENELRADWQRLQSGEPPLPIAPLG